MIIRAFLPTDLPGLNAIVETLHPNWFDDNALQDIPHDAQLGTTFVAEDNGILQGFIILSSQEGKAWINWLGVNKSQRHSGIGTQLIRRGEERLREIGYKEVRVETIVEQSINDGSYDETMPFYLKHGYVVILKKEEQTFENTVYRRGILLRKLSA